MVQKLAGGRGEEMGERGGSQFVLSELTVLRFVKKPKGFFMEKVVYGQL